MEPTPIPDYLLERLAAGDLPADDAAALSARLGPERERALMAALRADDAATLLAHPPARVAGEVRRRAGIGPARRRAPLLAALATAGALALAGLVWTTARPPSLDDGTRVKGLAPHLVVHRRVGDGQEVLAAGAVARAGDELQLGYVAAGQPFGAVVSIDGRGAATLHLPGAGKSAAPLAAGGEALLPASYRLDDAPRFERFFLVTGARPFAVDAVLAAARALAARPDAATAPLPVGPGLAVASLLLAKEAL